MFATQNPSPRVAGDESETETSSTRSRARMLLGSPLLGVSAATFAALSRLRRNRIFHPVGEAYVADLERSTARDRRPFRGDHRRVWELLDAFSVRRGVETRTLLGLRQSGIEELMKALLVIVVLLLVCVVLFVLGVFSPSKSRRMERWVDKLSKKGENKGDKNAGRVGDMTSVALEKARSAADASGRGGRQVNQKVTPD